MLNICEIYKMFRPLNCRGGCYFWLDPKVTKKSSQQALASLPHYGLCPANQAEPGAGVFCPAIRTRHPRFSKILMPLQPHYPPSFCLISAEAGLLTGNIINAISNLV